MKKVGFVSLGCPKNLVDTEVMIGILKNEGYEIECTPQNADVIIVNTCGFITDAKEESIATILEMSHYSAALVVTGCLAQRYRHEIMQQMPEIIAILGTDQIQNIATVVKSALEGKKLSITQRATQPPSNRLPRVLSTPSYFAYLKIAEGCDNACTYCAIPFIRGGYRSLPLETILEEASLLAKNRVKELSIVAQDTTYYGIDLYKKPRLAELLDQLSQISGIEWIRVHYCYPERIDQQLIDVIAHNPKIVKYLDIPLQHINDQILKRMGRKSNSIQIHQLLENLKNQIPGIAIRSTLITGFPGETPQQFEQLRSFVETAQLQHLGVFAYSQEEDTAAAQFPDQIDEEVAKRRRDSLMRLAYEIKQKQNNAQIGQIHQVRVEGVDELGLYEGRNYQNAYEVDNLVIFTSKTTPSLGQLVSVKIIGVDGYDLVGEVVE